MAFGDREDAALVGLEGIWERSLEHLKEVIREPRECVETFASDVG